MFSIKDDDSEVTITIRYQSWRRWSFDKLSCKEVPASLRTAVYLTIYVSIYIYISYYIQLFSFWTVGDEHHDEPSCVRQGVAPQAAIKTAQSHLVKD